MGTEERCGKGEPQRAQQEGKRAQLSASMGLRSTRTTARQREVSDGGASLVSKPESMLKTHLTPGPARFITRRLADSILEVCRSFYRDQTPHSPYIADLAPQAEHGVLVSLRKSSDTSLSLLLISVDESSSVIGRIYLTVIQNTKGKRVQAKTETGEQDAQRSILRLQWGFRCVLSVCALIDCWISRFDIAPDGVSYLDMGDLYWKGNWHAALNSLWSPLYGWIVGFIFWLTKPTLRWQYPEAHLLVFVIFLVTLACFEHFWRELLALRGQDASAGASRRYIWVLGYLLFASTIFKMPILSALGPDLIVVAMICLISGMILRFAARRMSVLSATFFGMALGIGYLAKAAMLPFGIVVLTIIFAVAWKQRTNMRQAAVASIFFLIVSAPFIVLLSWNCHRFTYSDAGSLNRAWHVNSATPLNRHWQDDGVSSTHPQHTTRKLLNWPEVYEFATPVSGTYPVWYDPTYWWAGVDARIYPARQFAALIRNSAEIADYWMQICGILTSAVLMLFLLGDRIQDSWRQLMRFLPILAPAVALFLMYAMIHWEPRYTLGAMLVVYGAVIASSSIFAEEQRTRSLRAICLIFGAVTLVCVLRTFAVSFNRSQESARRIAAAEQLRAMGMEPGDRVALIGDGFGEASWARLDRIEIVAEVPHDMPKGDSVAAFWNSTPQDEQEVLNILKSTGAKAVVANIPPKSLPPGWVPLGNSGRIVFFFR